MQEIVIDNVEDVVYLDSLTPGRLNTIHVTFTNSGSITNYSGTVLRLALALLRDQFPPKTESERGFITQTVRAPLDFEIAPYRLEVSAPPQSLKDLSYAKLMAAAEQAEAFSWLSSGGRQFDVAKLRKQIDALITDKNPGADATNH